MSAEEAIDLLDGLLYSEGFGCALTVDELRRYSRARLSEQELARRLGEEPLAGLVETRGDLVCLRGSAGLLGERPARIERARRMQVRAGRVARILRRAPFVRGLALTGSLAADDAGAGADADFLVVVEPGRLATVFVLLGAAARLTGGRIFCPNYYVASDRLSFDREDAYVARELAQARPLCGAANALWDANPWLREVFPNASPPRASRQRASRLQRLLERPLRGRLGARAEHRATHLAEARLRAHHGRFGRPVPGEVRRALEEGASLRFHGESAREAAVRGHRERRESVAARLEQAGATR